jgi:hypothetical protein
MPKKKSGKKKSQVATAKAEEAPAPVAKEEEPVDEPAQEPAAETNASAGGKKKRRKRKKKKPVDGDKKDTEDLPTITVKEMSAKEKLERKKAQLGVMRGLNVPRKLKEKKDEAENEDTVEDEALIAAKMAAVKKIVDPAPEPAKPAKPTKEENKRYTFTDVKLPENAPTKPASEDVQTNGKTGKKKRNRGAKVPNVKPKMDPEEQKKYNAMFGQLQQQATISLLNKKGTTEVIKLEKGEDGTDLKSTPTLIIKDCNDIKVLVERRTTKILVQNCENISLTLNHKLLTNTLECWRGSNVTLNINVQLKTMQLDLLQNVEVNFLKAEDFGSLIWNSIEDTKITFADHPSFNTTTGLAERKTVLPDSTEVDQFIVRIVEGRLLNERCVRLKNGFLSTEREAVDWEKRNDLARERYMSKFMKEAGIALNRDENKNEQAPNSKCNCGSGKKYKVCCKGKRVVTGIAGDKEITYRA